MSDSVREPSLLDRVRERPRWQPDKLAQVRPRDLAYRFAAGALTSAAAGATTLVFGARTGGVLLAFPAILAASLTLIESEEDPTDAREDARGAVLGALALACFAAVVALTVRHIAPGLGLAAAALAWALIAVGAYFAIWRG